MIPTRLPSWRARIAQALERAADSIRDALMDWDPDGEDEPAEMAAGPLPPLDPEALVVLMRGRVEECLRCLAEVVNEAPNAQGIAASEGVLRPLFDALLREALRKAEEMRVDAALAGLPAAAGPQGGWAERYRRILAGDGKIPVGDCP
jgi:hypothetical protein